MITHDRQRQYITLNFAECTRRVGQIPSFSCLTKEKIKEKFGFDLIEEPENARRIIKDCSKSSGTLKIYTDKLSDYIQNLGTGKDIRNKLIVCRIDDKVGCGVFAKENIARETMVAIYTGQTHPVWSEHFESGYKLGFGDYFVDARTRGGIARFFQHLPFNLQELIQKVQQASREELLDLTILYIGIMTLLPCPIADASEVEIALYADYESSVEDMPLLRHLAPAKQEPSLDVLNRIKRLISRYLRLHYHRLNLDDSLVEPRLNLEETQREIAYANLVRITIGSITEKVSIFVTQRDISRGEQLGWSYSLDYWQARDETPLYFSRKDHTVLHCLEDLSTQLLVSTLKGKYLHAEDIDQALRRAVHAGNDDDVEALLQCGANPSHKAASGRDAFHYLDQIEDLVTKRKINSLFLSFFPLPDTSSGRSEIG